MIRQAVVSDQFYPGNEQTLEKMLENFFSEAEVDVQASAGVAPHAGYVYSGAVAAYTFKALKPQKTFVLIGPDHSGLSMGGTCVFSEGEWETPLGKVKVDSSLAKKICDQGFNSNEQAHSQEHSLEVMLPFLQHSQKSFKIVPVMMGDQTIEEAVRLGKALKGLECGVVASSDFSHYVPEATAKENDLYAIQAVQAGSVKVFYDRLQEKNITACGYGPIAAVMTAFGKGTLLKYTTSKDASGKEPVVGYASIVFAD